MEKIIDLAYTLGSSQRANTVKPVCNDHLYNKINSL